MPFMENIQILSRTESLKSVGLKNIHRLYKVRNHEICIRNVRNMFNSRVIGSRPMYRDDILFNSNVSLLVDNVKVCVIYCLPQKTKCSSIFNLLKSS